MSQAPHLDAFIAKARYFIGVHESSTAANTFASNSRGNEIFTLYGGGVGVPWCAIFVSACATAAGVINTVIAKDSYARGIVEKTRDQYGGMWIDGPYRNGGHEVKAQPGDLILFKTGSGTNDFHVGLVESMDVPAKIIHTIEGNTSDQCARREYRSTYNNLYALVRPNWGKVGDVVTGYSPIPYVDNGYVEPNETSTSTATVSGSGVAMPLYNITNTRHDMTLREVGYLDSNYSLTKNATNIKVGVINYTTMLGAIYDAFSPVVYGNSNVDTSRLSGNLATCFNYLLTKGYNAAAVAGICGNIQAETGFNPSLDEWDVNAMSAGLCQWHAGRRTNMINRVGPDWKTNISGQLDFLCDELASGYSTLNNILLSVDDNVEGCKVAADKFVRLFEIPANVDSQSRQRQSNAVAIYNQLVFTPNTSGGLNSGKIVTQSGSQVTDIVKTVDVPSTVEQSGLIRDYTNYGYWYSHWNKSSVQYQLAQIWGSKGKTYDRNIATIDGCYLVAMTPTFGNAGDIVTLELTDGTRINCILGDTKGADAGNIWGHRKSNGISLVEWETYAPGHDGTRAVPQDEVSGIKLDSWAGQEVVRVYNRGTYLR